MLLLNCYYFVEFCNLVLFLISFHSEDEAEVLMQYMDIQDPLTKLRSLLEQRLSMDLSDYSFCLQDSQIVSDKIYYLTISLFYLFIFDNEYHK